MGDRTASDRLETKRESMDTKASSDQLQNSSSQDNKHAMTDEKLDGLINTPTEEKIFSGDQPQDAENDIKASLDDVQERSKSSSVSTSDVFASILGRIENRLEEIVRKVEELMKTIHPKSLQDVAESLQFTSEILKIINSGMKELTESLQREVQATAKTELCQLHEKIEGRLSDFSRTVNERLKALKEEVGVLAEQRRGQAGDANTASTEINKQLGKILQSTEAMTKETVEASKTTIKGMLLESKRSIQEKIEAEVQKHVEVLRQEIQASFKQTDQKLENAVTSLTMQMKQNRKGAAWAVLLLPLTAALIIIVVVWYIERHYTNYMIKKMIKITGNALEAPETVQHLTNMLEDDLSDD